MSSLFLHNIQRYLLLQSINSINNPEYIEENMKSGLIRWVVCTSSLDLGIDFQPVEQVVQIGSPKNIARLLQRAGRSAHSPGGESQVLFMPWAAFLL